MNDRKTCYHCDRVLPEKIDLLDPLSGVHGLCDGCRAWKAQHYAELVQRTGSAPAANEKSALAVFPDEKLFNCKPRNRVDPASPIHGLATRYRRLSGNPKMSLLKVNKFRIGRLIGSRFQLYHPFVQIAEDRVGVKEFPPRDYNSAHEKTAHLQSHVLLNNAVGSVRHVFENADKVSQRGIAKIGVHLILRAERTDSWREACNTFWAPENISRAAHEVLSIVERKLEHIDEFPAVSQHLVTRFLIVGFKYLFVVWIGVHDAIQRMGRGFAMEKQP
jgi:hypothetical protein